jgi:5-methylthioadenosine/S-adenosylhomocysteine deaminase
MIRTGTARFWDMYWHPEATARAVRDAGLRATIGGPLFDAEGGTEEARATALADLESLAAFADDGIGRALAPHSIYTVSEGLLRWTAETAAQSGAAVHIHLSETAEEVAGCLERHGLRPAAYLDSVGLLGERTVLAHGVHLDREELELIAARGSTVVANPVANMKLAVGGVLPYPEARAAGVALGLGTDGAGSNDSLDLLAGGAAPLEVGSPADFLLLRRDAHELGLGDLRSDLVYAASGSVVETTVVGGRALMRGGEVEGAAEVLALAVERAARLGLPTA